VPGQVLSRPTSGPSVSHVRGQASARFFSPCPEYKLTIYDLFQRERRYVVPLYQRAYVWNREEQWEPLWDDIERQAEACLKAEDFVSKRPHFLGAIVLNVSRIVGARVARSEIIDGQQRLTTLQILIAAIRDYAAQAGSEHVSRLRAFHRSGAATSETTRCR
jgi:uncharacterized protein with ParB-like and HNH nuclease domain